VKYLNNDGCSTDHKPVDTGLGFTCDEGVVELVLALNKIKGIKTLGSCEEGYTRWAVRRKGVIFVGDAEHRLLDVCLCIKALMPKNANWSQTIEVDNYCIPPTVRATLDVSPKNYKALIKVIRKIERSEKWSSIKYFN